jgi:hypothetical protein
MSKDAVDSLLAQGRLVQTDDPNVLSFTEDVAFASPSAAAAVAYAGKMRMGARHGRSKGRGRSTREYYKGILGGSDQTGG